MERHDAVPILDLSLDDDDLIPQIADACSSFGFFQIVQFESYVSSETLTAFQTAMRDYFHLPHEDKVSHKRHEQNARGYFDDELTKQKRDWKECLDVGMPGSRDWNVPDDSPTNACLDGWNVFPRHHTDLEDRSHDFRRSVVAYYDACATLSNRLAHLMARGLGMAIPNDFIQELADTHTSYLRLNYYPPCPLSASEEQHGTNETDDPLGISPHRDAGFLTILLQDDNCHSLQVWYDDQWITIHPEPRSLTINTGDMCMLWSNGRYQAPLHRVLTHDTCERYSAPFFYNPGYHQWIEPGRNVDENDHEPRKYHACLYGYFRAVRFAGDLTDLGVEIQTQDYEIVHGVADSSPHLMKQKIFAKQVDFGKPFSVTTYRPLLVNSNTPPDNHH
jgi:isopenicillin N synthase-like dioxygenase